LAQSKSTENNPEFFQQAVEKLLQEAM